MNEALAALLGDGDPRARAGRVLASQSAAQGGLEWPDAVVVPDRELARAIRDGIDPPAVVALSRANPTLLRALRERPPRLVLWCGSEDEHWAALVERPIAALLGPDACLRVGDGDGVLCATRRSELDRLQQAMGRFRLALSPTPAWLPERLRHPALAGCTVVGYVSWSALHPEWARWMRTSAREHVLVPLGVSPVAVDRPRDPALGRALAAHALEQVTGPVFPAPRVLAAIARGLSHDAASVPGLGPDELALWQQARRALPIAGAAVGMQAPDPENPAELATVAFLAQRSLLYARRARACLDRARPTHHALDPAGEQRARQVLHASGEILSEHESKVVLRGFGIEITRQAVASSASGAAQFAERIGFPVVLKAVSPDLRRKSEVGAVKLGLTNAAAVRRGYAEVVSNVEQHAPAARLDGVAVAEMIAPGLEIQCGAVRLADGELAVYGRPAAVTGAPEAVLAACPLSPREAMLLAHAVLARVPVPALRRASDPDPAVLAGLFARIAAMVQSTEERLLSIDLNPIRLLEGERPYVVLDARIVQAPHLEGT